jgi:hypothetical protein
MLFIDPTEFLKNPKPLLADNSLLLFLLSALILVAKRGCEDLVSVIYYFSI